MHMVTKIRSALHWSGLAVALLLLTACASKPPSEPEPVEMLPPPAEPAPSAPAMLLPDYPETYTVVRGDTLWDISARFLLDPWMWPEVWHGNPQVENPHLIYPGDVLRLYFIDGKPVLRVERPYEPAPVEYTTERLSPRVREMDLDSAITAIPIDALRPFLSRPRVITDNEYRAAPYVMAHGDGRMISGAGYRIYARGLKREELVGEYVVVRRGDRYVDPDTREFLGYEAIYLGEARLQAFGDPSTLMVTDSAREILNGDRLLPKEGDGLQHTYLPRPPSEQVDGRIISVFDGVSMIGQYRVVALNIGQREGIQPGHVLAVHQRGERVRDPVRRGSVRLPDERAGVVMVFRAFERVSYALVMNATKPLAVHDRVVNP